MYKIKSEFEYLRFKGKTIIQVISEYFIDILITKQLTMILKP